MSCLRLVRLHREGELPNGCRELPVRNNYRRMTNYSARERLRCAVEYVLRQHSCHMNVPLHFDSKPSLRVIG